MAYLPQHLQPINQAPQSPYPRLNSNKTACSEGFSLVELLIGVLLLAIAATGTISLFIAATDQTRRAADRNETEAVIEQDIALVLQRNDRFTCSAVSCSLADDDPDEDGYAPLPTSTAAFANFKALCDGDGLKGDFISKALATFPQPSAPDGITITRTATATAVPTGATPDHRYTVTWEATDARGTVIANRALVLAPTVANWCP